MTTVTIGASVPWTARKDNRSSGQDCWFVCQGSTRLDLLPYHWLPASTGNAGDVKTCYIVIHLSHQNGCAMCWTPNFPHFVVPLLSLISSATAGRRRMAVATAATRRACQWALPLMRPVPQQPALVSVGLDPFQDVLMVGCAAVLSSVLFPGVDKPNFDLAEADLFETRFVIHPDLITLDPELI
ncbi:hypothetical protein K438DRAFT_1989953 [Mycena galopus ATCC 62051]|nr:hypothetical protein K438DRAFT_1989953 [Mycena galopus ATCC 62051]